MGVLVVWNQSKHTVQSALGWLPGKLSFLKTNELLPMQEDVQMAGPCANRIIAATATADLEATLKLTLKPEDVPAVETFQKKKKDQRPQGHLRSSNASSFLRTRFAIPSRLASWRTLTRQRPVALTACVSFLVRCASRAVH